MPTEETSEPTQEARNTYRLTGLDPKKAPGQKVDRIVLEGSAMNPERYIDLNGEGELSDSEVERLRKQGYKLTRKGDNEGAPPEGEAQRPETKEEQQEAQRATAGVTPPVTGAKRAAKS